MVKQLKHPFVYGVVTAAIPLTILLAMAWNDTAQLANSYRWSSMLQEATILDAKARLGVCDYTNHCDNVLVSDLSSHALQPLEEVGEIERKKPQAPRLVSSKQQTSWAGIILHIAQLLWGMVVNIGQLFLGHQ